MFDEERVFSYVGL